MAVAAILGPLSLWLLGALALSLGGVRERGGAVAIAADFAAGAAILAVLGTAVVIAGLPLSPLPLLLLLAGLFEMARRRGRLPEVSIERPRDPVAAAILGLAALPVVALLLASVRDRLWWDGWAIWALKARVLFLEGTLPSAFLDPAGPYVFAHLDYPLAVPLVDWWSYALAGAADPALACMAGAIWFSLPPLLLWGALRERAGERLAALAALGSAAFWPAAFFAAGGAADIVVAVALLGAVVELARAFRGDSRAALWRSAVFLALGALAKNEGLAIAVVALIVTAVAMARRPAARRLTAFPLLLPAATSAPWLLYVRALGLGRPVAVAPESFAALAERVPVLFGAIGRTLISGPWLPLPLLAALGVFVVVRAGDEAGGIGVAVVTGYLAALCAAYLLTPEHLPALIATSLERVLTVLVPVVIFVAVSAIGGPELHEDARGRAEARRDVVTV